jgi:hypothetical protein
VRAYSWKNGDNDDFNFRMAPPSPVPFNNYLKRPPRIRIKSFPEMPIENIRNKSPSSFNITEIIAKRPNRRSIANINPSLLACCCCSTGRRAANIDMKITLSKPKTTSRRIKVISAMIASMQLILDNHSENSFSFYKKITFKELIGEG